MSTCVTGAHAVMLARSYFISISVQINKALSGQVMPEHLSGKHWAVASQVALRKLFRSN